MALGFVNRPSEPVSTADDVEVKGSPSGADTAERKLRGLVALGIKRTLEQDPAFAVRVMVDVANQGALGGDQPPQHGGTGARLPRRQPEPDRHDGVVGDLVTSRCSAKGCEVPVRRWEDLLGLGVTEIREYGSSSIPVMRRMRAMFE